MLCYEFGRHDDVWIKRSHPHFVLSAVGAISLLPSLQLEPHRGQQGPTCFICGTFYRDGVPYSIHLLDSQQPAPSFGVRPMLHV